MGGFLQPSQPPGQFITEHWKQITITNSTAHVSLDFYSNDCLRFASVEIATVAFLLRCMHAFTPRGLSAVARIRAIKSADPGTSTGEYY